MEQENIDEALLTKIWCRHLQCNEIDRNEDFFAIGGTSLQAAQIFLEIEQATGLSLPITVLFEAPTIAELAEFIQDKQDAGSHTLVLLKPGRSVTPLFLIHPIGGTVLVYRQIAEAMHYPGPVYGIQAIGVTDDQPPHASVEEMAAYYCDEVTSVQPEGPVQLAGYSAGGIIAYAMAQRFSKSGREIGFLGLINTHFMFRRVGQQVGFARRIYAYIRYVREKNLLAAARDFSKNLHRMKKLKHAEARLDAKGTTFDQRRQRLINQILEQGAAKGGNRYSIIQQLQQIAINFYQPSVYPGTVYLYRTEDYHNNRPGEIGWERMAGGGINRTPISGTHLTLVGGDHAVDLAAKLSEHLGSGIRR